MNIRYVLFLILFLATKAICADFPYKENANANFDLQQGLQQAITSKRLVLIVFGANWCKDCLALDSALKSSETADFLSKKFVTVKVDVGNFDHNLELVKKFGNPIKGGIPAAVVLSSSGELLYSTRAGELSSAKRMSESGIYNFFLRLSDFLKVEK